MRTLFQYFNIHEFINIIYTITLGIFTNIEESIIAVAIRKLQQPIFDSRRSQLVCDLPLF